MLRVAIIGASGLLLGSVAARAGDFTRTTEAGTAVLVTHHAALDEGCGGSIPPIQVTQAPAHGTVDVRPARFVMKGAFAGRTDCNGREVDGAAVWYTPAAGYHGSDGFALSIHHGRKNYADSVRITVK